MEFRIYAQGPDFEENASLPSFIDLLTGYELSINQCIRKASVFYNIDSPIEYPRIKLTTVNPGSTVINFITETLGAVAPLAPDIFGYSWQLYKSAYDLIIVATQYFHRNERPMTINIQDSPGTTLNIVNGDQVNTTRDVFNVASKIHPFLEKIASLIKGDKAERIVLEAGTQLPELPFDRSNKNSFKIPSVEIIEEDAIDLECSIYRFNKKSLKGSLEFYDGEQMQIRPFTIPAELLDACMESFTENYANVTALREIEKNAIGETKVKKFHLITITPVR